MLKNIGALLGLGMSLWLYGAGAQAAEGVDMTALATARGKAEAALQGFESYNDEHKSGWTQLWFRIDNAHTDSSDILSAELQKETRKPEETKNNANIEDLQKKIQENERAYNRVKNQTAASMGSSLNAVRAQHNALKSGFDQFSGPEQSLKTAKNDLAPVKGLYEAIEKRDVELQAQAKEIIDALAKIAKEWEDKLAATKAIFFSRKEF